MRCLFRHQFRTFSLSRVFLFLLFLLVHDGTSSLPPKTEVMKRELVFCTCNEVSLPVSKNERKRESWRGGSAKIYTLIARDGMRTFYASLQTHVPLKHYVLSSTSI